MTELRNPVRLHQSAEYLLELQGRLDPAWSATFEGMTMAAALAPGGFAVTVLRGVLADQSALHGLLNRIFELGLPLLKLECVCTPESNSQEES
jgi:hypothetical protein